MLPIKIFQMCICIFVYIYVKKIVVCKVGEGNGPLRPPAHQMDGEIKITTQEKKKKSVK